MEHGAAKHFQLEGQRKSASLETKVKSFCAIPQVLAFLKDYIIFAEKDEELNKYILRQHQTAAVDATIERATYSCTYSWPHLAYPG